MVVKVAKTPTTQDMAAALKAYSGLQGYSPETQGAVRYVNSLQSQIEALRAPHTINTGAQLGVELLADAILDRKLDKKNRALDESYRSDLAKELTGQLGKWGAGEKPPSLVPVQEPQKIPEGATPPIVPQQTRAPIEQRELPPIGGSQFDPDTLAAIARTVWGEARGEDAAGQQAVASVILNRAKASGMSPRDVVMAPGQFEPWGNPQTRAQLEKLDMNSPELQAIMSNIGPALAGTDLTGGADHFYAPAAQSALGRAPPSWDNGKGVDLGRHRFFKLGYGGGQAAGQPAPQPPAPPAQPYDIASIGATPPPPTPSAGMNAPATPGGAAPSATPPPSGAGGANPLGPTPGEIEIYKTLLSRGDLQGAREFAAKINERMAAPPEFEIQMVNGRPVYVPKTPGAGQVQTISTPGTQDRVVSARELGIAAPEGTYFSVDPNGKPTKLVEPPSGYQRGTGGLSLERGGPQDPTAGGALIEGEAKLRGEYGKAIANYSGARDAFEKVIAAAKDPSGASDVAIVYGVMKTLDPISAVREGEYATAENTGGIDDKVRNIYNRLLNGERLTPEQRANFVKMARGQFGVYERQAQAANEQFRELATSYGFNPARVVRALRPVEDWTPPTAPPAQTGPRPGAPQYTIDQLRAEKARRDAQRGGAR